MGLSLLLASFALSLLLLSCQNSRQPEGPDESVSAEPSAEQIVFVPGDQSEGPTITFDSNPVNLAPVVQPEVGKRLLLSTTDGLSLAFSEQQGFITELTVDSSTLSPFAVTAASGFFVRDVAAQSDYIHVGGTLTQTNRTITHTGEIDSLDLTFNATYKATADSITIHAMLTNLQERERAVTLYFALPVDAMGWSWGDDIRNSRPITGTDEFANLGGILWTYDVGATGTVSKYPWAALNTTDAALALAVPLDQPRLVRLVYNPQTAQFYAAFDLGLSPLTTKFPNQATIDLQLYRVAPENGFRAATQAYYDHFPAAFARRISPADEGLWVAFADLSTVPRLDEFGIGVHELGNEHQLEFDESAGILAFRYLSEPWSHWLPITTTAINAEHYDDAITYLQSTLANPLLEERSIATLNSALFDEAGRYQYEATDEPWCHGVGGCALFLVNPDPDIRPTISQTTKASLDWNPEIQNLYTTLPTLDGEYIDSLPNEGNRLNFRTDHWPAADIPLVYRKSDQRVGLLEFFSVNEFMRWVAKDVWAMDKLMMANGAALEMPWGADLVDFSGQETNWLTEEGAFAPIDDTGLSYRRTLMSQRPYSFLMNTDFEQFDSDLVERYFQLSLFYGFYPSMGLDIPSGALYWEKAELYERDRPLFQRYIPLIKQLNQAGWQPVTHATTSDEAVLIERFGQWPDLYFTLRNSAATTVTVDITIAATELALPAGEIMARALIAETALPLSPTEAGYTYRVTLSPERSEVIAVQ